MSFDLRNDGGEEMMFSNSGWRYMLEFAESLGVHWPTSPDGEDADALTAAQASELADVIDRGLGTRSAADAANEVSGKLTQRLVLPSTSAMFRSDPIVVNARAIDYWREFARFARHGGFSINF